MKALSLASTDTAIGPTLATAVFKAVSLPLFRETSPDIFAPTPRLEKLQDDCYKREMSTTALVSCVS